MDALTAYCLSMAHGPTADPDNDWADHMRICLTVDATLFAQTPPVLREHQERPDVHGSENIDELYQATMDAKESTEDALKSLWGPVLLQSIPFRVHVEGASGKNNKKAGAGTFFGPDSRRNKSVKVPGPGRLMPTDEEGNDFKYDRVAVGRPSTIVIANRILGVTSETDGKAPHVCVTLSRSRLGTGIQDIFNIASQ